MPSGGKRGKELILSAGLASGPRSVVGGGDAGFGEGLHIVQHVQRCIHDAFSKAGGDTACCFYAHLEQEGLYMQDIGLDGGT